MDQTVFKEFEDFFLEAFGKHITNGHVIEIEGLGYYFIQKREARIGINPATGERVKLHATKTLGFLEADSAAEPDASEGPDFPEDFGGKVGLESWKRDGVPVIRLEFPRLADLFSAIRLESLQYPPGLSFGLTSEKDENLMRYRLVPPQSRTAIFPDGTYGKLEKPEKISIRGGSKLKKKIKSLP